MIDTLHDGVVVEHAAGGCADAHRDNPLGFHHLVVDLTKDRCHLLRHATGDDHEIGLTRRSAERFHAITSKVVVRSACSHHFERATRETERGRHDAVATRPLDEFFESSGEEVMAESFKAGLEESACGPGLA